MTKDIGSLAPVGDGNGDWRNTAIIGGQWENDGSLAFGFLQFADAAVERWKAGRRNDAVVIPIIYGYRGRLAALVSILGAWHHLDS